MLARILCAIVLGMLVFSYCSHKALSAPLLTVMIGSGEGQIDDQYMRAFVTASGLNVKNYKYLPAAGGRSALAYIQNSSEEILLEVPLNMSLNMAMDPKDTTDLASLNWIGSLSGETNVLVVRSNDMKINTFEDLRNRGQSIFFAQSVNFSEDIYAMAARRLGTNFKFIKGYRGKAETLLSVDRGETEITNSSLSGNLSALKVPGYKMIVQMRMVRDPILKDIPAIGEYIKDEDTRALMSFLLSPYVISHPILVSSKTSIERVKYYQKIFDETVNSPMYLELARKNDLSHTPVRGSDIAHYVSSYRTMAQRVNAELGR